MDVPFVLIHTLQKVGVLHHLLELFFWVAV